MRTKKTRDKVILYFQQSNKLKPIKLMNNLIKFNLTSEHNWIAVKVVPNFLYQFCKTFQQIYAHFVSLGLAPDLSLEMSMPSTLRR